MSIPTSSPASATPLIPTLSVIGPACPYLPYYTAIAVPLNEQVFEPILSIGQGFAENLQVALNNPDYLTANQKAQDAGTTIKDLNSQGKITPAEFIAFNAVSTAQAASMAFARAATHITTYVIAYADVISGFTVPADVANWKNLILSEPALLSYHTTYLPIIENILNSNSAVVSVWRSLIH